LGEYGIHRDHSTKGLPAAQVDSQREAVAAAPVESRQAAALGHSPPARQEEEAAVRVEPPEAQVQAFGA